MRMLSGGDEGAFAELVRRHQQTIMDYLCRLLRDRGTSEDLAQEVFLRVFRHRDRYSEHASFRTWCYAIATNLARDEIRSLRKRPAALGEEAMAGVADRGEAPSEAPQREEMRRAVTLALERIPEHFREVLALRDLQGCSYEEISDVLRLELGTVKSRINRARVAFKESFLMTSLGNEVAL